MQKLINEKQVVLAYCEMPCVWLGKIQVYQEKKGWPITTWSKRLCTELAVAGGVFGSCWGPNRIETHLRKSAVTADTWHAPCVRAAPCHAGGAELGPQPPAPTWGVLREGERTAPSSGASSFSIPSRGSHGEVSLSSFSISSGCQWSAEPSSSLSLNIHHQCRYLCLVAGDGVSPPCGLFGVGGLRQGWVQVDFELLSTLVASTVQSAA